MSCPVGSVCGCNFKNTGAKYGKIWDKINKVIDNEVGCEECNIHGHESVNGIREHIKVGIGNEPFNQQKYKKFVDEVNCVYAKCVKEGRCK